jgi:hypothetical protein
MVLPAWNHRREKYHRGWGYVKYMEVNALEAAGCNIRGQDAESLLNAPGRAVHRSTANTYTGKG